jgi:hypothetical protein
VVEHRGSLCGYWFLHPRGNGALLGASGGGKSSASAAFFVGYLISEVGFTFLALRPPECVVFVSLAPVDGDLHHALVLEKDSLVRKTFDYIRLLTHRPPRFVFHQSEAAAMVRHQSMRDWPPEKYEHFSRNFFIETLAWLVRSGIVRKLLAEPLLKLREEKPNLKRLQTKRGAKKRRRTGSQLG